MSRPERIERRGSRHIFAAPAALALASLAGLVLGLTGDGWRDLIAALFLFLPIAVFIRSWLQRG